MLESSFLPPRETVPKLQSSISKAFGLWHLKLLSVERFFLSAEGPASFWSCSWCHLYFLCHLNHVEKSWEGTKLTLCTGNFSLFFLVHHPAPAQPQNKHQSLVQVPSLQIRNRTLLWSFQKTLPISTIITLAYLRRLFSFYFSQTQASKTQCFK